MMINCTKEQEYWRMIARLERRVRNNPFDTAAKRRLKELMK